MTTVTGRIKSITQPYGGYVKPKAFTITQLEDHQHLHTEENLHGSLVGLAVDYLTRFMLGAHVNDAFDISRRGAAYLGLMDYVNYLTENIGGLDPTSIIAACKLVTFDSVYRAGTITTSPNDVMPDQSTISNIQIMVQRCLTFFEIYGPMTQDGFTFEGGYTDTVSSGDGDFLTKHTLWDLKVLRGEITSKHTLQVLMYYLMGKASGKEVFACVNSIGFYNPRQNKVYTLSVVDIDPDIMDRVKRDVIGY